MLSDSPKDAELSRLTNAALALLARREYARGELQERLQRRSDDAELIEQILDALIERGLQSDERFCESFVRYRIHQGKGPAKIRQDLRLKRISSELLDQVLPYDNEFWVEKAEETYRQKFKDSSVVNDKDKAKRLRFMVSRGFSAAMVFPLIESSQSSC